MIPEFLGPSINAQMETEYGIFQVDVFAINGTEIIVLHTADIPGKEHGVLCRIQSECISHVFADLTCDCAHQIQTSLRQIQDAGSGLLIYLRQEGMGLGIAGKLVSDPRDWRTYSIALEILRHYGISSVDLISINRAKTEAIERAGITVRKHSWHEGMTVMLGSRISRAVEQVRTGDAFHPVDHFGKPRVFVVGDLNIDRFSMLREPAIGGTAYYVAVALKVAPGFEPIVFGKVGRDPQGASILQALGAGNIYSLIGEHESKATGEVHLTPTGDLSLPFQCIWDKRNNANDYDESNLEQALVLSAIGSGDYIFLASYLFVQKLFVTNEINAFIQHLNSSRARILLDINQKAFAFDVLQDCGVGRVDASVLQKYLIGVPIYAVIGDMSTFDYLGLIHGKQFPDGEAISALSTFFSSSWVICRYASGRDLHQRVASCVNGQITIVSDEAVPNPLQVGSHEEMVVRAMGEMQKHEQMNQPVLKST